MLDTFNSDLSTLGSNPSTVCPISWIIQLVSRILDYHSACDIKGLNSVNDLLLEFIRVFEKPEKFIYHHFKHVKDDLIYQEVERPFFMVPTIPMRLF
mgnify:CR=1 FL=1